MSKAISLSAFQHRVEDWNKHNFPVKQPHQPLLGVVEEFCDEFVDAVRDGRIEDAIDALGDTMVYLADYCNQHAIWMQACKAIDVDEELNVYTLTMRAVRAIGKLAHSHLKAEQKIRGNAQEHFAAKTDAVGELIALLSTLAVVVTDRPLDECMMRALLEIEQRDWIKYPKNGRTE